MFKKYDYYITDLINSKNPNIYSAKGKFGGDDENDKNNITIEDDFNARKNIWWDLREICKIIHDPTALYNNILGDIENDLSDETRNNINNIIKDIAARYDTGCNVIGIT